MKQITCAQMGGPATCTDVFTGNTAEELVGHMWTHIKEAHPDMAEGIKNNPKEVNDKWQAEFRQKFDQLPDAKASA